MASGATSTLSVTLVPKLDKDKLAKEIKAALESAFHMSLGGTPSVQTTTQTSAQGSQNGSSAGATSSTSTVKDPDEKKQEQEKMKKLKAIQQGVQVGFQLGEKAVRGIFSIVQDLYQRVKQSSAFLQAVENLFNLAMTLLLMPLGNALAETILPATVELVESVVGLWDQFDEFAAGGDLQGIITTVLDQGLRLIGDYFKGIAGQLTAQGGLLGAIGKLLDWIGKFVAGGGLEKILNIIFNAAKFIADYFPYFVGLYVANEIVKIGLQLTQIAVTAASESIAGKVGFGGVVATAGIASLGGALAASSFTHAGGADYPPTPGGHLVRVAEGGEWESITPSSKKGGGNSGPVYITINGYTQEEVIRIVREEIRTQIIDSHYRNGM